MRRCFVILVMLSAFFGVSLKAQITRIYHKDYAWDSIPTCHYTDSEATIGGAVILRERLIFEYEFNQLGELELFFTLHKTIKVFSEDAVDTYNKIYVSLNGVSEIIDIRARFISKEGVISETDKSNMKHMENLEESGNFKVFAVVGAEPNGIIDYYYTLRREPFVMRTITVQQEEPLFNHEILFACPGSLKLMAKAYNGYPELEELNDSINDRRILYGHSEKVDGLRDERYSAYEASLQRIEAFIAYNYNASNPRIYSFNQAARDFHTALLSYSSAEKKALKRMLKQCNPGNDGLESKIRNIELWVKSNIFESEEDNENLEDIVFIEKNKHTSTTGFARIFASLFNEADIPFQVVITCNRSERAFDKSFDSWNYFEQFLFYFPDLKMYLCPDDFTSRLGFPPQEYTENYGLSFKTITVGDVSSFVSSPIFIESNAYQKNGDSLFMDVVINSDFSDFTAQVIKSQHGYSADYIQAYYELLDEDNQKSIVENVLSFGGDFDKLSETEVINGTFDDAFIKPFIMKAVLSNSNMIERAGDEYIFRVGELIGPQAELYDSVRRTLPADHGNASHYYRKLNIRFPENYIIVNPEALNVNAEVKNSSGDVVAWFKTTYTIDGNLLTIVNNEVYTQTIYPLDIYEGFRNVVNAAADFNEIKLIFRKTL